MSMLFITKVKNREAVSRLPYNQKSHRIITPAAVTAASAAR